ncbi:hypothetical protein JCM10213_003676 [Rhodosporidiobolus nylandii]
MGSWLSRPREVDYDTVLSALQDQISARQAKLQQIRLRERRANALFVTYGVGLWFLYTVLWYFNIFGGWFGEPVPAMAAKAAPVVVGPVVVVYARKLTRWFYRRKQDKEEATLKVLTKKKQDKVEEIKKKTGYYSTRDLLEKYDEALKKSAGSPGPAPGTPAKQLAAKPGTPAGAKQPIPFPTAPGTPQRPASALAFSTPQQASQLASQLTARGPPQFPAPPSAAAQPFPPATPATRSYMDKLADALLGVTAEEATPSKYALICGRCFAHNGLVPPETFDFVQYQCPRCGFFNPRRREPPSSSDSPAQQQQHHRRVQSEFGPAPSPLQYSQSVTAAGVGGEEREEERKVVAMLLPERDAGWGGRQTTALKEGSGASRRKGRKASEGSDDRENVPEDDRMEED